MFVSRHELETTSLATLRPSKRSKNPARMPMRCGCDAEDLPENLDITKLTLEAHLML